MISSVSASIQGVETRSSTVVPFKSLSQDEETKTVSLKKIEKEQTEERQGKVEKAPEEDRKAQEEKISQHMLDELANDIETIHSVGLSFAQHKDSGRTMVKVMNRDTDELIREIPAEDVLDMAVKFEEMVGLLFDEKV